MSLVRNDAKKIFIILQKRNKERSTLKQKVHNWQQNERGSHYFQNRAFSCGAAELRETLNCKC